MLTTLRDPVCGARLNPQRLRWHSRYQDHTYYFCSTSCKSKFDKSPETYVESLGKAAVPAHGTATGNKEPRPAIRATPANGTKSVGDAPTIVQLRSWALVILGLGGIIGFCYLAKPVIIPFILALYLSLILNPLVNFATSQLKIPRTVSSILVVLLVLAIILAGLYFLIGQAQSFMQDFPKYAHKLRTLLGSLQKEVRQIQEKTEVLAPEEKSIPEVKISSTWTNYLANLGTVFEMVSTLVLVLFFVLFLLKDQDIFKKKLISIASRTHRKLTLNILDDISQNIQQYLVTMSLINLALVGIHTVSFFLQGIPYFYIWGLLVGALNFIPYVGPFIALIPPTLMAIVQYEGWGRPLLLVAIYAFIQNLEGNYITPSLVGRQVDLNPIAILLSAIFWTWLWGPVGLLLSTPLLVSLKVVLDRFENLRPIGIFLGESVEEPEGSS